MIRFKTPWASSAIARTPSYHRQARSIWPDAYREAVQLQAMVRGHQIIGRLHQARAAWDNCSNSNSYYVAKDALLLLGFDVMRGRLV